MASSIVRTRLAALVAVLPFALFVQSRAAGQDPALEVYYNKLEPKEQFQYKIKGKEAVASAGVFRWEVPASSHGTGGLAEMSPLSRLARLIMRRRIVRPASKAGGTDVDLHAGASPSGRPTTR